MNDPVLCYIADNWAYFTTQPLEKQWGEDWHKMPYEHNAGRPYEWNEKSNVPKYEIIKVAWEANMQAPCGIFSTNTPYSVERINQGAIAWLSPDPYSSRLMRPIYAGTPLSLFKEIIKANGGKVYEAVE